MKKVMKITTDSWSDVPTCPHCGQTFVDTVNYADSGEYVCDACGQTFYLTVAYQLHQT